MAGIEEAFEKFVQRVSSQEEPIDEYGDPQTGEKRIPLIQGIKRGYDFKNTMPNIYNLPRLNQVDLAQGGVASMFRKRLGYAEGGTDLYTSLFGDTPGQTIPTTLQGKPIEFKFADPERGPAGGYYNVFTDGSTRIPEDQDYNAMNEYYTLLEQLSQTPDSSRISAVRESLLNDLKNVETLKNMDPNYNTPVDFVSNTNLKLSLLDNLQKPKTTEVPTIDPFNTSLNNTGFELKKLEDGKYDIIPSGKPIITSEGSYILPSFYPGEYVLKDFGHNYQLIKNISNQPQVIESNIPTIDPFSGQQVSAQDQLTFTQPQAEIFPQQNIFQPPSPVDQFIGERRFQSEADAAARSGIPFTKKIQDYLPNIGFNVPGHMDYFNKIREAGLPQSEYNILGTADLVQRNIDQLPSVLKPAASVLAPAAAFASSIPYEGIQAYQRMQPGSGVPGFINAYLAENPFQTMMSRTTGASQPLANQIQNLLSPTVSSAQRSQQEAAARVTPKMANGGRVSMSDDGLTTTVPPVMGPDSQGVESLFRRRYN